MASDFDNLQDNQPPEDLYGADVLRGVSPSLANEDMWKAFSDRFFAYLPPRLEKSEKAEQELAAREQVDMTLNPQEDRTNAEQVTAEKTQGRQAETIKSKQADSGETHPTATWPAGNTRSNQRPAPSPHLEDLAVANLTNRHLLGVYRHLERRLERKIDQAKAETLSAKDVERLLDNHLKQVHGLLDKYFAEREAPTPAKSWRQRLGDYKQGLVDRMERLKNQADRRLKAVKATPGQLKTVLQDKLIDGFISLNGRIATHADAVAKRVALHRSVPKGPPRPGDERIAEAYRLNYQKIVFNDFVGREYYPIDKQALAAGDAMFSPDARFQLRREALNTWLKQGPVLGHGEPGEREAEQFRQYLIKRDAALATSPASLTKRQAFLDQDLGDCASDVHALRQQISTKNETPDREATPSYTLPPRSKAHPSVNNNRAAAAEHIL
ncbi:MULTISPECIES: hypothetical protein [unclassified Sporolactobacillus]|uniref:hypothetical protein n=1 Tax=unclassified Sporolactobacillus TaxID=2628533 RepID=UPI002367EB21|nr:hypothetical protein [Sporolactobacillus sp. CQH2019]MDD9150455.1 hypothetical protein [Sporolactobacillus sp. CQH2019]